MTKKGAVADMPVITVPNIELRELVAILEAVSDMHPGGHYGFLEALLQPAGDGMYAVPDVPVLFSALAADLAPVRGKYPNGTVVMSPAQRCENGAAMCPVHIDDPRDACTHTAFGLYVDATPTLRAFVAPDGKNLSVEFNRRIKPDKTRNGTDCARRLVSAYRELGWFRHMSDGLSCPICGGPVRVEPYGPIPGKYVLTHYQRDNPNCPIAHNFGHSLGAGLYDTGYEAAAAWRSGHSVTP